VTRSWGSGFPGGELTARIVTSLVGLPLLLGALWLGGQWWITVVAVVTIGGTMEFARLHAALSSVGRTLVIGGAAAAAAIIARGPTSVVPWALVIAGGIVVLVGVVPLLASRGPIGLGWVPSVWVAVPLGIAYLGGPSGVLVRWRSENFPAVVVFLAIVWGNDIAAYFVGSRIGRHKLALRISPGKSWEGAIAGALVAGGIGMWVAPVLGLSALGGGMFGVITSVASQGGDLFESALKRRVGVKDSGRMLPGHGGILDRFDGILFAAPLGYALFHAWTS